GQRSGARGHHRYQVRRPAFAGADPHRGPGRGARRADRRQQPARGDPPPGGPHRRLRLPRRSRRRPGGDRGGGAYRRREADVSGADRPGEPATVSCAELVGRTLAQLGVTAVFGVVGSGNYVVTDALVRAGATFTAARHEAGAVGMADGYFRASGRVAAASVHQGPGLTNTITALTEAGKSRVPLVLLAGATSAGATRSNFYLDQDALVRTAGAASVTLHRPETVVDDTVAAYRRALAEQIPVVLHLPLDVQAR